jgi:uncharacterized membrane protein
MVNINILFMGDDDLQGAASYLGGAMIHLKHHFKHVPSVEAVSVKDLRNIQLLILSDYCADRLSTEVENLILQNVRQGMSLWMIGGWDSFCGQNGGYEKSRIGAILPLMQMRSDDRMNSPYPWAMMLSNPEASTPYHELQFDPAPCLAGLNKTCLAPDAELILETKQLVLEKKTMLLSQDVETLPLLACRYEDQGKVLAFASDLAPHWAGGFVDWGSERIAVRDQRIAEIEVGDQYLKFISICLDKLITNQRI